MSNNTDTKIQFKIANISRLGLVTIVCNTDVEVDPKFLIVTYQQKSLELPISYSWSVQKLQPRLI